MPLVDSHVHFYDPRRPGGIPWPEPSSPIYRPAWPDDLRGDAEGIPIDGAVAIECSPNPGDDDWLLSLARGEPLVAGVVANLRADQAGFPARVERCAAAHPKLKGIRLRPIAAYDLRSPDLAERLTVLAELGLTLELGATDRGILEDYARLAERLPAVPCLLDHFGHPTIDGRSPPPAWAASMKRFAAIPNTACKLTGLLQFWAPKPPPTQLAPYRPILDLIFEAFGPDRVLYGSNWPPLSLAGSYADNLQLYRDYLSREPEAADRFFAENAKRIYKLNTP